MPKLGYMSVRVAATKLKITEQDVYGFIDRGILTTLTSEDRLQLFGDEVNSLAVALRSRSTIRPAAKTPCREQSHNDATSPD